MIAMRHSCSGCFCGLCFSWAVIIVHVLIRYIKSEPLFCSSFLTTLLLTCLQYITLHRLSFYSMHFFCSLLPPPPLFFFFFADCSKWLIKSNLCTLFGNLSTIYGRTFTYSLPPHYVLSHVLSGFSSSWNFPKNFFRNNYDGLSCI